MAAKQPDKKDVSVLNKGTDRVHVIAEFGKPLLSEESDGCKVDIFVFVQGYSGWAKGGRAVFHGVADVFTLGLWEVFGTPIEGIADGTEVKVQVYYDDNDKVKNVKVFSGGNKLGDVDSSPSDRNRQEATDPAKSPDS